MTFSLVTLATTPSTPGPDEDEEEPDDEGGFDVDIGFFEKDGLDGAGSSRAGSPVLMVGTVGGGTSDGVVVS